MTNQEAIKYIENHGHISDDVKDMAIKALEKQIPKHDKNDCGRCKDCGTNNNFIINKLGNPKGHKVVYCWNCGQSIDWSEKE